MESKKKPAPTYTGEFGERGVRLYREHRPDYTSDNAAYRAIASKLGCSHDTLRARCLQAARDAGERAGLTTTERARLKELERENREPRTAIEILKKGEPMERQWCHSAIGNRPPQEVEDSFHERMNALENAAQALNNTPSRKPGAVQAVYAWSRKQGVAQVAPVKGLEGFNRATPVSGPTFVDATVNGRKLKRGARLWTVATATFKAETYGYGLPAAAMVAAARLFGGDRRELTVTLCEIAATAFAFLMVALQLRLWTSGSLDAGRWELLDGGVQALWWMLAGAALLDPRFAEGRRWAPPAGTAAVAAGTALVLFWLLTDRNPLLVPTPVGRWPLVNLLGLAYLAPALILAGLAIDRRRAIGDGWRLAFAATAGVLIFVWLTLEVRRAFWGSEIALFLRPPSAAEVYAYSAAWIAYALALLALGLWRGSRALRYASLAVLMATVAKVFLYDMSGLTGLWRVASFLGLGLTLIGIGRVYGLHILPAERRAPEQP